jgi:hypothetical protein
MTKEPVPYNDEEAERRATEALRRALTTPYKPHSELVGKKKRRSTPGETKSTPKAREVGEA